MWWTGLIEHGWLNNRDRDYRGTPKLSLARLRTLSSDYHSRQYWACRYYERIVPYHSNQLINLYGTSANLLRHTTPCKEWRESARPGSRRVSLISLVRIPRDCNNILSLSYDTLAKSALPHFLMRLFARAPLRSSMRPRVSRSSGIVSPGCFPCAEKTVIDTFALIRSYVQHSDS